jgi:hypothetical protein
MFNRYLPKPVYENLPAIYVVAAVILAFVAPWPWAILPVGALLTACAVTVRQRRQYRAVAKVTKPAPIGVRLRVRGTRIPVPPRRSNTPSMPLSPPAERPGSRQILH